MIQEYYCKEKTLVTLSGQRVNRNILSAESKCVLGCFIKGTGLGFAFGNVADGTDCEKNSLDKCIEGQCTVRR